MEMTPPIVDEKALHAAYKDMRAYVALDIMQEVVEAYLAHAPQPDLQKLIGQMEGIAQGYKSGECNAPVAIDRCIDLLKAAL